MATYYVSHAYGGKEENYNKAKSVMKALQYSRPNDCFLCPIFAFSHFDYGEMSYYDEMELRLDLLSLCDGLIVASKSCAEMQKEIEFAKLVDMEVEYIEPQNSR